MKKISLIVLGILCAVGNAYARPAVLSVQSSTQVVIGQTLAATATINTGGGVLGAADFLISYDTHALTLNGVGLSAGTTQFQNSFYANPSQPGAIHILALNGASLASPTGAVAVATM